MSIHRKSVASLVVGDYIVNHGKVEALRIDGVFTIAKVAANFTSLADGTMKAGHRDITWHNSQEVYVG